MESSANIASRSNRGAAIVFATLGASAIVFGGLFSAATARSATYHSAWFVAYLVLVVGVAQMALGLGQWWLTSRPLSAAHVVSELVFFNIGNAGVIIGTLLAAPFWVDAGSIWIVVALALFGWRVWSPRRRGAALWLYWMLIVLLFVSVLVGLFFAHAAAA
ncbi:MAG: hypothetical protein IT190_00925 [Microbacteriaceae bacterium]|nr:hypothetical protein [Microbacteriaceae bacterium]